MCSRGSPRWQLHNTRLRIELIIISNTSTLFVGYFKVDYVFITINVNDVNDNRPLFERNQLHVNHVVDFDQKSQTIDLVVASDLDRLDSNKLSFSIESCVPAPKNLLLKKQTNSVCSLFSIVQRPLNQTSQLVSFNLDVSGLERQLAAASDLFLGNKTSALALVLDVGVKDSLGTRDG